MLTFANSIQQSTGSLSQKTRKKKTGKKKKKRAQILKENVKLSLFADMIFCSENPNITHTHTQIVELINKFSKVARYKINMQKSFVSLYTNNEQVKKEINNFIYSNIKKKKKYRYPPFWESLHYVTLLLQKTYINTCFR